MKTIAHVMGVGLLLFMSTLIAGSLTAPNTFVSGTPISASEMNANFDEVEQQVTDNHNRITALEAGGAGPACTAGMRRVGPICVDIYEASIWDAPAGGNLLDNSACDEADNFAGCVCSPTGNDCSVGQVNAIYARSVSGVLPAQSITWFMAQQACYNVGKRLITNAEWQAAAAGSPDPGAAADPNGVTTCNTNHAAEAVVPTGSSEGEATACVSSWGIFDMVGNIGEWTADWILDNGPRGDIGSAGPTFGNDFTRHGGMANGSAVDNDPGGVNGQVNGSRFPAAIQRGGDNNDMDGAGVFNMDGSRAPSHTSSKTGFRCGL